MAYDDSQKLRNWLDFIRRLETCGQYCASHDYMLYKSLCDKWSIHDVSMADAMCKIVSLELHLRTFIVPAHSAKWAVNIERELLRQMQGQA